MSIVMPAVVFLDDELPILTSLERTFRKEMFEVRTTALISQALKWSKDPNVKLLVSDYRMAEMTGLEVLRIVQKSRPELKRFILSGFADEELIKKAVLEGAVDQYLLKPWNVDDLRARILSAIG